MLTIDRLMRGDGSVADYYRQAAERWQALLGSNGDPADVDWAVEEAYSEKRCEGDPELGREVFAWSLVAWFWDEDRAFEPRFDAMLATIRELLSSSCSAEAVEQLLLALSAYPEGVDILDELEIDLDGAEDDEFDEEYDDEDDVDEGVDEEDD